MIVFSRVFLAPFLNSAFFPHSDLEAHTGKVLDEIAGCSKPWKVLG